MNKNFCVTEENKNKRLDLFLIENVEGLSRSRIKTLIESGMVMVNGKTPQKSGAALRTGDMVQIEVPQPKEVHAKPENIPIEIVYQDKDIAVVNKPQGMVTHAGNGNSDKTLVNALLYHIKDLSGINGDLRPGIVHRLYKNTAGLLVVAKNDNAHRSLAKQIEEKTAKRTYWAIIEGHLKESEGTIRTGIMRHPKNRLIMTACAENEGKLAVTNYKVLQEFPGYSLVEFELKTGRTHQIRMHCKDALRHPIAGDVEYGGSMPKILPKHAPKSLGQYLVAKKLELTHPTTGERLTFEIEVPEYFACLLHELEVRS